MVTIVLSIRQFQARVDSGPDGIIVASAPTTDTFEVSLSSDAGSQAEAGIMDGRDGSDADGAGSSAATAERQGLASSGGRWAIAADCSLLQSQRDLDTNERLVEQRQGNVQVDD